MPVVRSDGSGTTAQFTRWLASQYTSIWDGYCGRANCGFTSNYPVHNSSMISKGQSTGVAGYVAQDSSEGSITYVEYSYARNASFPVVKVLNKNGYYIEPKAANVAVALQQAQIRSDLTQDLSRVYVDTDPRTYPLSSYSYMILPTDNRQNFSNAKGRTLSEFAYYFLCEGQQQADALGYSPLPKNLVQAGVQQVARVPGTTNKLSVNDLAKCNNPTFSADGTNTLAKNAPQPDACDKQGATQCTTGTGGAKAVTPNNGGGPGGAGGGGPGGTGGSGPGTTGTDAAAGTSSPNGPALAIDPDTGQPVNANAGPGGGSALAIPVSVDVLGGGGRTLLIALAVALLLSLVFGPPLTARFLRRRKEKP